MVKLLGAAIVIISGGVLGFYQASRERKRLEQGIELKRLLYLLQGEIRYGLTPLPDAIGTIAGKMNAEFSVFLSDVSKKLSSYQEETFSQVWKNSVEKDLIPYVLEKKMLEPLITMGDTIGYLDKDMQVKTIDFTIEQIEERMYQIKDQVIKNCKLYQSLGLSFGLLVVIILL